MVDSGFFAQCRVLHVVFEVSVIVVFCVLPSKTENWMNLVVNESCAAYHLVPFLIFYMCHPFSVSK